MWPFNRNKTDDQVPQEVQSYYQAERRERTGIAWMLALGTLVATVLLAIGLYFGGRWLYRSVFDNDDKSTQEVSTTSEESESRKEEERNDNESSSSNPTTPSTPNTPAPSQGSTGSGSGQTGGSTTPRTGPLPATGPTTEE